VRFGRALCGDMLSHQEARPQPASTSRCDIGKLPAEGWDSQSATEQEASSVVICLRGVVVAFAVVAGPLLCRYGDLGPPERCGVIIVMVLLLNIMEVMPLYCTALFIPVLGTLCEVLGAGRDLVETSSLLVGNFFNNISFLVLGALVINGIFTKCGLEKMFMDRLLRKYEFDSPTFLLFLMMGSMAMCSVLYSGSIMLLAALRPVVDQSSPPVAKRILLGVAFASNAGSTWLPISSPVNLIAVALLGEFDTTIEFWEWSLVAVPVSTLVLLGSWFVLLKCFPADPLTVSKPSALHLASETSDASVAPPLTALVRQASAPVEPLTGTQKFFLLVAVASVLGITVFADWLKPVVGHPACISLCVVVLTFGSGFMSRQEFVQLDWDLLALVGGTNVMAFLVRETGLGAALSAAIVGQSMFTTLPFWGMLCVLVCSTVLVSTAVGHSLTGVLLLPLMVAVGVKLQAAETTAMLIAIAIPLGMGMPHSSFDNMSAYMASQMSTHRRRNNQLKQGDFYVSGCVTALLGAVVVLSLGFGTCFFLYGPPPPVVFSETGTPKDLKPKVIKENLPKEANHVLWNKAMPDWKAFLDRPDKKAFAVSDLEPGKATRAWAASWNHVNQEKANTAAIRDCESVARKCYLIWPRKNWGSGHASHDPGLVDKEPDSDGRDKHDNDGGQRLGNVGDSQFLAKVAWPPVVDAAEEALWLLMPKPQAVGRSKPADATQEKMSSLLDTTSWRVRKIWSARRFQHVALGHAL